MKTIKQLEKEIKEQTGEADFFRHDNNVRLSTLKDVLELIDKQNADDLQSAKIVLDNLKSLIEGERVK